MAFNFYRRRALAKAVTKSDFSVAAKILAKGVDPNFTSSDEMTPLKLAVEEGDDLAVRLLIQYGADPYFPSSGVNAVEYAYLSNLPEFVDIMREETKGLADCKPETGHSQQPAPE